MDKENPMATSQAQRLSSAIIRPPINRPAFTLIDVGALSETPTQEKDRSLSIDPFIVTPISDPSFLPDVYQFSVSDAEDINLTLHIPSASKGFELFQDSDQDGRFDPTIDKLIGGAAIVNSTDSAINTRADAGTYFVRITGKSSPATHYDLNLSATPEFTPSNLISVEHSAGLKPSHTFSGFSGTIQENNTSDIYKLSVLSIPGQSDHLGLSLSAPKANTLPIAMRLFQDKNGDNMIQKEEVIVDTGSPTSLSTSQLVTPVQTGNYLVQVYSTSSAGHAYNLAAHVF
jgi:hypothetical protein